jgi:hypothetical protein
VYKSKTKFGDDLLSSSSYSHDRIVTVDSLIRSFIRSSHPLNIYMNDICFNLIFAKHIIYCFFLLYIKFYLFVRFKFINLHFVLFFFQILFFINI